MGIWEEDSGAELFETVPEFDMAELFFRFVPDTSNFTGSYQILERDPHTLAPIRAMIHLNGSYQPGNESGVQRIILHELGHALGIWQHSHEIDHVMSPLNQLDRPTAVEIRLMRMISHMDVREDVRFLVAD
jgi:predicted Zn-dependent protease